MADRTEKARDVIANTLDVLDAQVYRGPGTRNQAIAAAILDELAAADMLVRLPEPDEVDDDGQIWFGNYELCVDGTGRQPSIYWNGAEYSPRRFPTLRARAAALLAALAAAEDAS